MAATLVGTVVVVLWFASGIGRISQAQSSQNSISQPVGHPHPPAEPSHQPAPVPHQPAGPHVPAPEPASPVLPPMPLLAGLVAAVTTLCLLMIGSRPDRA
ncbi:hypothetical protein LFM09_25660 [Lentzea alba]|uniref:hypothetical protein n=1 Tax=Lentzea alba TaxID=2714351 RepID=UPI0039BFBE74